MTSFRRGWIASVVALTACAQVLGLDEYGEQGAGGGSAVGGMGGDGGQAGQGGGGNGTTSWKHRLVGSGSRFPVGVGVAPNGLIFVPGHVSGELEGQSSDAFDLFIATFKEDGTPGISRLISSAGDQFAGGIDINGVNQIFVIGQYKGQAFTVPAIPTAVSLQNSGGADGFILRLDVALDVDTAYGFSGAGDDAISSVAVGPGGVYLAGLFHNDLAIASVTLNAGGGSDGVVSCLFGCEWADGFDDMADQSLRGVDVAGDTVVAVGSSKGDGFVGLSEGCYGSGLSDMMIVGYDTSGQRQWSKCFATSDDEQAVAVVTHDDGTSLIAGSFADTLDLGTGDPLTPNATDTVVFRLDANGTVAWATPIGGAGDQHPTALAEDAAGDIWVVGFTAGTLELNEQSYAYLGGATDGFVARLDANGIGKWAGLVGGEGDDRLNAVGVTVNGTVVAAGSVQGDATVLGVLDPAAPTSGTNDAIVFGIAP